MQILQASLQGKTYDGFPISTGYIPTDTAQVENVAEEAAIEKLSNPLLKLIRSDSKLTSLKEEYKFFNKHAVQQTYALEYRRCSSQACQHCCSFQATSQENLFFFFSHAQNVGAPPVSVTPDRH
jgi:hypothetical protein